MTDAVAWPRVGCGVAIVENGRLLLVRRRREPEADHWGVPGGKVDPFEPLTATAVREAAEELGIEIRVLDLLCLADMIDPAGRHHWLAVVFRATRVAGEPRVREPDALSDAGWFALDDLPSPLTIATTEAVAALARDV